MDKSPDAWGRRRRTGGGGKTNLASCVVATVFLILVVAALVAVFLVFFQPKDPKIQVDAVQLPSFSAANGTVNFTFAQHAAVCNPNHAAFSHYDSMLQLVYVGNQRGESGGIGRALKPRMQPVPTASYVGARTGILFLCLSPSPLLWGQSFLNFLTRKKKSLLQLSPLGRRRRRSSLLLPPRSLIVSNTTAAAS